MSVGRLAPARVAAVVAAALVAQAVAAPPARAERVVAFAPLATMGAEDTSAGTRKLGTELEAAFAALADTRVVGAAQVLEAIRRAKRPQLKACEGEAACLAELGRLVGATVVVSGELGGLGDAQVVYLRAVDVTAGKELRSTTLAVGAHGGDGGGPRGAAVRLLDPDAYVGALAFTVPIAGATVYVDGRKLGASPVRPTSVAVGTHAVRVTHPEYRDFVRFVDVEFGADATVNVELERYAVVERDLAQVPGRKVGTTVWVEPPWYRRWYVLAGGATGLAVVAGVVAAIAAHHVPTADACRVVGAPGTCAP